MGAFYIVQTGVNVFFTVFFQLYHKIGLCKEEWGEEGSETSRASADRRHG